MDGQAVQHFAEQCLVAVLGAAAFQFGGGPRREAGQQRQRFRPLLIGRSSSSAKRPITRPSESRSGVPQ